MLFSPSQSASLEARQKAFLGPTSFSAIFSENDHNLETVDQEIEHLPVVQENISWGAHVISIIVSDLALCWKLHVRRSRMQLGFSFVPAQVYRIWYDGVPSDVQTSDAIRNTSWQIWQNTMRPMQIPPDMSILQWAEQSTGRNLRWEVIGLVRISTAIGLHVELINEQRS